MMLLLLGRLVIWLNCHFSDVGTMKMSQDVVEFLTLFNSLVWGGLRVPGGAE